MAITPLPPLPSIETRPETFDNDVENFFGALPTFAGDLDAARNQAIAASEAGASGYPYEFDTGTSATAPASGGLKLNNANATLATAMYLSATSGAGAAIGALLDTFDDSTSAQKGVIRLVNSTDPSKWAVFKLTAISTPAAGWRTFTIVPVNASGTNPFGLGDSVALQFAQIGDKGEKGDIGINGFTNMVVLATTQSWTVPAGITRLEIAIVDGGASGQGMQGQNGGAGNGGKGGDGGISVIQVSPGTACTATIGAGGAAMSSGANPGGSSSFSGAGFTTVTSANSTLKVPGGYGGFAVNNAESGDGGGSMLAPPDSSGYGAGGKGGFESAGEAGRSGVIVIRY